MAWHQFSIQTTKEKQEWVEDTLLSAGAVSITLTDAKDQPILEPKPEQTPTWDDCIVTGLFMIENDELLIQAVLQNELDKTELNTLTYERLADKDWVRAWLDDFKPMQFGQRLWVVPTQVKEQLTLPQTAVPLKLDPGLAFGTGTHATTRLCLKWLDTHCQPSDVIMDFGCGSGILAIAGLLLGAQKAYITDIDPQAITATYSNAKINRVSEKITHIEETDLSNTLEILNPPINVWLANILASPLIELAPLFAQQCSIGCSIVLSGILEEQAQSVLEAYQPWFEMDPIEVDDGWVLVSGKRCK